MKSNKVCLCGSNDFMVRARLFRCIFRSDELNYIECSSCKRKFSKRALIELNNIFINNIT